MKKNLKTHTPIGHAQVQNENEIMTSSYLRNPNQWERIYKNTSNILTKLLENICINFKMAASTALTYYIIIVL